MKAIEHYFPVVLLIMLYRVVLIIKSVGKILKCVSVVCAFKISTT